MNIVPLSRSTTPQHPVSRLLPRSMSLRSSRLKPSPPRICPSIRSPLALAELRIHHGQGQTIVGRHASRTGKVLRRVGGGWTDRGKNKAEVQAQLRSVGEKFTLFTRAPHHSSPVLPKAFRRPTPVFPRQKDPSKATDSPEVSRWVGSTQDSPVVVHRR